MIKLNLLDDRGIAAESETRGRGYGGYIRPAIATGYFGSGVNSKPSATCRTSTSGRSRAAPTSTAGWNNTRCSRLSDDYLKAPYSTLERHAALWQAAKKRPGFVLLVVVKPCKLPTLSDHLRRCELFGVPEDAARVRFKEFMSKRCTSRDIGFPGKVFAVSNIPMPYGQNIHRGRFSPLLVIQNQ
jgi:hypothetical protein